MIFSILAHIGSPFSPAPRLLHHSPVISVISVLVTIISVGGTASLLLTNRPGTGFLSMVLAGIRFEQILTIRAFLSWFHGRFLLPQVCSVFDFFEVGGYKFKDISLTSKTTTKTKNKRTKTTTKTHVSL